MKKKSGIFRFLAHTTILPLMLFGVICCIFGSVCISATVADDTRDELEHIAKITASDFDMLYPGDYSRYEDSDEILITKGDTILNANYDYIDSRKEDTDLDFTLFYQDMRVITTLRNSNDERIIGTKANPKIVEDVITNNTSAFYRNVDIFGIRYYCYYEPLYNSDGSCVGMLAVLMPATRLYQHICRVLLPLLLLIIVAGCLAYFWSYRRSVQLTTAAQRLSGCLNKIADGTLSNTVPPDLLARRDEFGEIAHSIVSMQSSLRVLVEQDVLTGVSNRRAGQKRLQKVFENAHGTKTTLSVALGDIDFFKKCNDTYGHECGDVVLSKTAHLLQEHIKDYGFCCRWGGEEFLIVLTKGTYDEHIRLIQSLIDTVASNPITYDDNVLSISMTFGLIDTAPCSDVDDILRRVDHLLYEGKKNGRNRLVTIEGHQEK
jgi:diguanylate cyclase (GGDEF)-like protein